MGRAKTLFQTVSTHSRLKAAGCGLLSFLKFTGCFNTQPPEGGWGQINHCCARGCVSTHSRLKAAGKSKRELRENQQVSTHSRLKAAGTIGRF